MSVQQQSIELSLFYESSFLRVPVKKFARDTQRVHACYGPAIPIALACVPTAVGFQPVAVLWCGAVEFYDLFADVILDVGTFALTFKMVAIDATAFHIAPIRFVVSGNRLDR